MEGKWWKNEATADGEAREAAEVQARRRGTLTTTSVTFSLLSLWTLMKLVNFS